MNNMIKEIFLNCMWQGLCGYKEEAHKEIINHNIKLLISEEVRK